MEEQTTTYDYIQVVEEEQEEEGEAEEHRKVNYCCLKYDGSGTRMDEIITHRMHYHIIFASLMTTLMIYSKVRSRNSDKATEYLTVFYFSLVVLAIHLLVVLKIARRYIIPFCFGKRKLTKKHDDPLDLILPKLYAFVLNEEELAFIDQENNRGNLALIEKVMKKGLKITGNIEHLMAGSTAERLSLPIIPHFIQCDNKTNSEYMHAIFSDFDYMVSCTDDRASFSRDAEKYFVSIENTKLNPGFVYILDNQTNKFVSAKHLQELLLGVTKLVKVKDLYSYQGPRHICYDLIMFIPSFGQVNVKGPAIEVRIGRDIHEFDFFYCEKP